MTSSSLSAANSPPGVNLVLAKVHVVNVELLAGVKVQILVLGGYVPLIEILVQGGDLFRWPRLRPSARKPNRNPRPTKEKTPIDLFVRSTDLFVRIFFDRFHIFFVSKEEVLETKNNIKILRNMSLQSCSLLTSPVLFSCFDSIDEFVDLWDFLAYFYLRFTTSKLLMSANK